MTDTEIPVFGPHFYTVGFQVVTQHYSIRTALCLVNIIGRYSDIIIIIIIIVVIIIITCRHITKLIYQITAWKSVISNPEVPFFRKETLLLILSQFCPLNRD
jgi:hypothetical protein